MVSFRSMTEEEYSAYLEYFIPDYAIEIASNYRMSKSDSLTMARQEISKLLAEGVNTHGQILLSIFAKLDVFERHVGYLWYKPDAAMRTVFIYDFHIFNSLQEGDWVNRLFALLKRIFRIRVLKRLDYA